MLNPMKPSRAGSRVRAAADGQCHGDRRADGHAVEEGHPHEQHAEDRDHHGAAGEQHGPPGRGEGLDHGLFRRTETGEGVAVAADDEQGVVDADAEADHRGDLDGEVRRAHEAGEDGDQAAGDDDAEQAGDDRQAHGQHASRRPRGGPRWRRGCRTVRWLRHLHLVEAPVGEGHAAGVLDSGSASFFSSLHGGRGAGVLTGVAEQREGSSGDLPVRSDLRLLLNEADAVHLGGLLARKVLTAAGSLVMSPNTKAESSPDCAGNSDFSRSKAAWESVPDRPPAEVSHSPLKAPAGEPGGEEEENPGQNDELPALVAEASEASEHGFLQNEVRGARRFSGDCLGIPTAALEGSAGFVRLVPPNFGQRLPG